MSTLYVPARTKPSSSSDSGPPFVAVKRSPWVWMAVACTLLGISGGIRFWRDAQFRTLAQESAECPFPMKDFPSVLGNWRGVDGSDSQLDPAIARIAGSSDHLVRSYVDEKSGEKVVALLLYGPAATVYAHTPEICYPAAGYAPLRAPKDRAFSLPDGSPGGTYRSAYYVRRVGATMQCTEVYQGFLHNGEWLPDASGRWKSFRYHPGMFKVQLERQLPGIPDAESSDSDIIMQSLFVSIAGEIAKLSHPSADSGVNAGQVADPVVKP